MKIHILQHEYLSDGEAVIAWAERNNYPVTRTRFYLNEKLPEIDFDLLCIMGGTMNVYEEDKFPWLIEEKIFIKKVFSLGKKITGFCLGAQLLAVVLGGKVTKNQELEIGWHSVSFSDAARKNPALNFLPEKAIVFQWHEDTFSALPPGAVRIASNAACSNQGFAYNDTVAAFQFHFEINTAEFEFLVKEREEKKYSGKYVQTAEEIRGHAEFVEQNNRLLFQFLDTL
jgi:GMP synthase-like glutamine amidotransferase